MRERIESQAGRIATGGTVGLAALVAADIKTRSEIVKDRNIGPEQLPARRDDAPAFALLAGKPRRTTLEKRVDALAEIRGPG